MQRDPTDKTPSARTKAAAPEAPPARREMPLLVEAPAPYAPRRGPRDTRRYHCAGCVREAACSLRAPGEPCPLERDAFAELRSPERLPKLLRDAIAAEFRTYFRAKRAEADRGDKIDGEASKMLQGLIKALESYLDLLQRVDAHGARGAEPPAELFPSLAAALAASGDSLFSEVPDPALRDRLRAAYVEAIEREDLIIRDAIAAARHGRERAE